MLLFIVCYAASAGVGEIIIRRYPKRYVVVLSFPLLLIVAAAAGALYYSILYQSMPGGLYVPTDGAIRAVFSAGAVASVTMWISITRVKRNAEIAMMARGQKDDEDDAIEEARNPPPPGPKLTPSPSDPLGIALRYRDDLAAELERVRSLGAEWEICFLQGIQRDPKADPEAVIRQIEFDLGEVYPLKGMEIDRLHSSLRHLGPEATREFRSTLWLLGDKVAPASVAAKIEAARQAAALSVTLVPGVYVAGRMKFRVRPDHQISVITGYGGEDSYEVFPSFEDLRKAHPDFVELATPARLP